MMRKVMSISLGIYFIFTSFAIAAPIYFSGNGHYYDFVYRNISWQDARLEAESYNYLGSTGYLATITSASENEFLSINFSNNQSSQFAWIGGWESSDDGIWKWVVGPEAGTQFSYYKNPTSPFNYANWGGVEPNDDKYQEDFAMFNIGTTFMNGPPITYINTGQWADASPNPSYSDPVVGYFVEYSASPVPEPASMLLLGSGLVGLIGIKRRRTHRK